MGKLKAEWTSLTYCYTANLSLFFFFFFFTS